MKDWQTRLNQTIQSVRAAHGNLEAQRLLEYLAPLPDGHKEAISLSLRQGMRFPFFKKARITAARQNRRVAKLRNTFAGGYAYYTTEYGRFAAAMLRAAHEHNKTRDLWDAERIMTHTFMGMMVEIPGAFDRHTVSLAEYGQWIGQRDRYANSCGGWAAMLLELLPEGRDEDRWTDVVDSRDLNPGQANNHVRTTLNGNWAYVYVSMGCHAFVLERVGTTQEARVIQVWSNMHVAEQGFNYAYSFEEKWGYIKKPIDAYRDAMVDLIDRRNENRALKTIIPDPRETWGIDPRANAETRNLICLIIKTLAEGDVAADIKANLVHQIDEQVTDYANNGLAVPDV